MERNSQGRIMSCLYDNSDTSLDPWYWLTRTRLYSFSKCTTFVMNGIYETESWTNGKVRWILGVSRQLTRFPRVWTLIATQYQVTETGNEGKAPSYALLRMICSSVHRSLSSTGRRRVTEIRGLLGLSFERRIAFPDVAAFRPPNHRHRGLRPCRCPYTAAPRPLY